MGEVDLGGKSLGSNIVFEFPSVQNLESHLFSLWTGQEVYAQNEIENIQELIAKYSTFPSRKSGTIESKIETMVRDIFKDMNH